MFKVCFFFTFCFLLHNVREIKSQQPEEICFRPPTNTNPGRPGKRGPPGGKGDKGDVGPTGQCVCDGMSQLRQEMRELSREVLELKQFQHSHTDKLTHCSVGMKDRRVRDEDITASALLDVDMHHPKHGRLDNVASGGHIGAWASGNSSSGNWIQVDLQSPTVLTGVVTQGRPGGQYMQWVTSYKIAYGINQTSFQTIQNSDGNDLIFQGNRDINTKVTNMFPAPIIGRYVRLMHITYHGWATIRLEYLTC
ncbi:lactadherin-like [Ciona intestinalis]